MKKYFCFGGTNIDIQALIADKVAMYESNPSKVRITYGGVARNIARAIGNFAFCELVSAFSHSSLFVPLLEDLHSHNVSTSLSKIYGDEGNSLYIDIVDKDGVLVGASDMSLVERLAPKDLEEACALTSGNDIIILDTNLSHAAFEYILTHAKGYKAVDAVSSKKLSRVLDLMHLADLVKVNTFECEMLKGTAINDCIITKGNGAIVRYLGKTYSLSHRTVEAVNPTGCGDTFFGTFLANLEKGTENALTLAVKAATASALSIEAVPSKEEIDGIDEAALGIVWEKR